MAKVYRLGTRSSPLALRQAEEILSGLRNPYPDIKISIVGIETLGDRQKNTPLSLMEGTDFFTREIDEALLDKKIDFAVHSAKDLAQALAKGLVVAAKTESIDPYDVLVSKHGLRLNQLPFGARIGTSSQRRKEALKRFRPDFQIVDIRGNIQERLTLLDQENAQKLDAIVIAAAGLIRLGLQHRITQKISFDTLKPHPDQGKLAVVARSHDEELISLLRVLDAEKQKQMVVKL